MSEVTIALSRTEFGHEGVDCARAESLGCFRSFEFAERLLDRIEIR
jgi:hypothetical protein